MFILFTLLLKISGLLRDMVVAYYFGDTYQADAYLAAFIIPNMIFLFLTTGMKNAFVPSYVEAKEKGGETILFNQLWKATGMISLVLAFIGILFSPVVIPIIYPNFQGAAMTLAIHTTMIFMGCIMFVGLNAVFEAYLDAESKYIFSVISQIIVLGTMISAAILLASEIGPYALAIGYLIGTIVSLLFKIILVYRHQMFQLATKVNWKEVRAFFVIFIPVAITVMVGQVNLAVDNIFASYFKEGVVTYVNYAKNLVHFPQAIFAVTIGTITFPLLAKSYAKKKMVQFNNHLEQGLMVISYVIFPAIVGMMVLMPSIIRLLFERGAFTAEATNGTAVVAYYYAGSVLFFSLAVIVNNGLYTLKKGHMLMMIGLGSILLNLLCNWLFTSWIGYIGIPLASSVVGLCYAICCYGILSKQVGGIFTKPSIIEIGKMILAVLIMAGAIVLVGEIRAFFTNSLYLIFAIFVGIVIYALCSYILKIQLFYFLLKYRKKQDHNRSMLEEES
ncbi:lipid II flippase MurJ [Paraliobacillus ryukyuensis]|uniref:Lipid II flippase n=1 Tax=Paraliobacillus ryukyuensis TaxID=200904 RepID=A0A366EDW2_9BACI|nr:murein biosynthesis integral membrane protein MurJ [Paraliobacillus ryukyuensis]RBP00572.1 putative peptidoglycan lipid II flippase [Paraliobacillus ryukyuensis]